MCRTQNYARTRWNVMYVIYIIAMDERQANDEHDQITNFMSSIAH